MMYANAPIDRDDRDQKRPRHCKSSIAPPGFSLELIRLERFVNCFSPRPETIRGRACSNTVADGGCPRARARRALPSGDERAFQELVDRYKDLVFALIARTVQDRSRAEDLAQDVFLRIHRGLPYFRGEARLSTWIYRIVANVCLQEHGRPARGRVARRRADADAATPSASDRQFGDLELRDRLEKAIARLPANYRLLDRRALSRGRAVRGSGRSAAAAARHGEDAAVSREAAAAADAGDGSEMSGVAGSGRG